MALRLKDRRKCPPNGFLYEQKQTGWRNWIVAPQTQWDFNLLCSSIQQHRRQNPRFQLSTDLAAIQNEVDLSNSLRVAAIPGAADQYLINDPSPASPPKSEAPTLTERLAHVVAGLRKVNSGRVMLLDWEAAGYPQVTQELAEHRAKICASCPKNGKGDFTKWFTIPASEHITKQIERLKDVKLSTTQDANLGVCEICLCPLKLKMHAPMEYIGKYLSNELKAELGAVQTGLGTSCWVIDELK
jgi:hypothetical protein